MLKYNKVVYNKPKHSTEFFFHQSISYFKVILKLSYFRKNYSWKMEVLQFFSLWDQEIDSWFTNNEPLIPTLHMNNYLNDSFKSIYGLLFKVKF